MHVTQLLFYINFQFGSFSFTGGQSNWASDLLINAAGAFIGILGALLIYFWQVCRQRKDTLKYVSSLLDSIIRYTQNQGTNCEKLAQQIKKKPTKLNLLSFVANNDLKRLTDKVDQEGFYHAYLSKYKRRKNTYKTFKELYGYLDFIDRSIDELRSIAERQVASITNRKKVFAEKLSLGLQQSALLLTNPVFQKNEPALLQFLNQEITNYYGNQKDIEDLDYAFNSFVVPVKSHLATNYPSVPECNEIVISLKGASNYYSAIGLQSASYSDELMEAYSILTQKAQQLEELTQKLRSRYKFDA